MMAQGAATLFTSISAIGGRLTVSEHHEEAWNGTQVLVQNMLAFSDFFHQESGYRARNRRAALKLFGSLCIAPVRKVLRNRNT
jgi:hypothetical protein